LGLDNSAGRQYTESDKALPVCSFFLRVLVKSAYEREAVASLNGLETGSSPSSIFGSPTPIKLLKFFLRRSILSLLAYT